MTKKELQDKLDELRAEKVFWEQMRLYWEGVVAEMEDKNADDR